MEPDFIELAKDENLIKKIGPRLPQVRVILLWPFGALVLSVLLRVTPCRILKGSGWS